MDVEMGDLLVARLWQWDAERLRKDAERDHTDRLAAGEADPDYSISVFAKRRNEGQPVEALIQDLCQHIGEYRSAWWVTFTTDRRLRGEGFLLRLSEPPPDHYDVVLGADLDSADLPGLAAVLGELPRRRFPTCAA